jgi:hypothetical protein
MGSLDRKEIVTGFKMAIIHRRHPEVKLDHTQVELIQAKLLTVVVEIALGEIPPQLLHTKFAQGIFWITCANEPSKAWIMRTIGELGELW